MCTTPSGTLDSLFDGIELLMPGPQPGPPTPNPGGGSWGETYGPAIISGVTTLVGGERANAQSRAEAARNRKFQERMRDTAWQASVADMEAAGLNPALAYSKGPAASPGGSMASQMDTLGPAVSSAMQGKRLQEELKQIRASTLAAKASAFKTDTERINQQFINKLWGSYTGPDQKHFQPGPLWKLHEAESTSAAAMARIQQLQIPSMKNLANIASSQPGQMLAWIKYLLQSIKR